MIKEDFPLPSILQGVAVLKLVLQLCAIHSIPLRKWRGCSVWVEVGSRFKTPRGTVTFWSATSSWLVGLGVFLESLQSWNFSLNRVVSLCWVSLPNTAQSGRPWPFLEIQVHKQCSQRTTDLTEEKHHVSDLLNTGRQEHESYFGMSELHSPGSSGLMSQFV